MTIEQARKLDKVLLWYKESRGQELSSDVAQKLYGDSVHKDTIAEYLKYEKKVVNNDNRINAKGNFLLETGGFTKEVEWQTKIDKSFIRSMWFSGLALIVSIISLLVSIHNRP